MEAHNHLSLLCAPLTWDPATTGHLLVQLDFPLLRINKIHEDCATCITEQERPTLEHPESSNCRDPEVDSKGNEKHRLPGGGRYLHAHD
ncbi:uncharacterized protein LOC134482310 isoform X2 [Rattus norvegicus]|uniref:uncharacterized protein LOC134482310 isoform X2 n=1 Tax=Rattus norvegicus TaxID=10116 RepID=UPI002FD83A1C